MCQTLVVSAFQLLSPRAAQWLVGREGERELPVLEEDEYFIFFWGWRDVNLSFYRQRDRNLKSTSSSPLRVNKSTEAFSYWLNIFFFSLSLSFLFFYVLCASVLGFGQSMPPVDGRRSRWGSLHSGRPDFGCWIIIIYCTLEQQPPLQRSEDGEWEEERKN